MPVPIPLINLPIYSIDTFLDNASSSQPTVCGIAAKAITDLRPKHSAQIPATKAPRGFEITPREAIHEACDWSTKFVSRSFGIRIALYPWESPTEIWPKCAAKPAKICKCQVLFHEIFITHARRYFY